MNAKAERRERSHGAILDSAARLLRQRGIGGARVADVMEGAGLTVGGFYAHFASKEALLDETLARTGRETRARLFRNLEQRPIGDRALTILKRYLSPAHRDETAQGCPLPAVVGEVATTAPEHRAALASELDLLARELESHLPAQGEIGGRALALGLVALMYGGLALARALRDTPLSDEVLKACRELGALVTQQQPDQDPAPQVRRKG